MTLQRVLVFTWLLLLSGIQAQIDGLGCIDTAANVPISGFTICPKECCMDKPECLINIRRLLPCSSTTFPITAASCGCSFGEIDSPGGTDTPKYPKFPLSNCPKEYCMDKPECWINVTSSRPCISLTRPITAASCRCSFGESGWPFPGKFRGKFGSK
ncbi:uncharacterized protein [Magallana gigas]|uniref:uncharacterized protein isoform X2 n=1 Tax=Magallana gigas TaxID=29159 RepID=UPI00333F9CDF